MLYVWANRMNFCKIALSSLICARLWSRSLQHQFLIWNIGWHLFINWIFSRYNYYTVHMGTFFSFEVGWGRSRPPEAIFGQSLIFYLNADSNSLKSNFWIILRSLAASRVSRNMHTCFGSSITFFCDLNQILFIKICSCQNGHCRLLFTENLERILQR